MPPSNIYDSSRVCWKREFTSLAQEVIVRRDIVLARTTRRRTERRLINEINIRFGDRENIMK